MKRLLQRSTEHLDHFFGRKTLAMKQLSKFPSRNFSRPENVVLSPDLLVTGFDAEYSFRIHLFNLWLIKARVNVSGYHRRQLLPYINPQTKYLCEFYITKPLSSDFSWPKWNHFSLFIQWIWEGANWRVSISHSGATFDVLQLFKGCNDSQIFWITFGTKYEGNTSSLVDSDRHKLIFPQ